MPTYFDNRFPIDEALTRISKGAYDFSIVELELAEKVLFDNPDYFGVIEEDGEIDGRNYVAMRNLKFDGKSYSGLIQFDMGVGIFYNGVLYKNAFEFTSKFIDEIKAHLGYYTPMVWKLRKEHNSKLYKGVQIPQNADKLEALVTLEKVPNSPMFMRILAEVILKREFK